MSLAEARAKALENRKLARLGGDPLQAKREALAVLTFEEAARTVHALHKPIWKTKSTRRNSLRHWKATPSSS